MRAKKKVEGKCKVYCCINVCYLLSTFFNTFANMKKGSQCQMYPF